MDAKLAKTMSNSKMGGNLGSIHFVLFRFVIGKLSKFASLAAQLEFRKISIGYQMIETFPEALFGTKWDGGNHQ